MASNVKYLVCFLFLLIGSWGCQKETNQIINWELLQEQKDYRLWSAHFLNADTGYVCGGSRYDYATLLYTNDGGHTWQEQTTGIQKILFDIQFVNPQFGIATAYESKVLITYDGGKQWTLQQQDSYEFPWQALRAVHFINDTLGLIVGGRGYNMGQILRTTNATKTWDSHTFEHELRDVWWTSTHTAYACGYGVIYKTTDGGDSWQQLAAKGDFFTSIHFPSPTTGYVVGYQGSILKTTDAGNTWLTLRRGESLFNKSQHFERVYFYDELQGVIVGTNSCLHTQDGGDTWQQISNLDFQKFNAFVPSDTQGGFIVGDEGTIIRCIF